VLAASKDCNTAMMMMMMMMMSGLHQLMLLISASVLMSHVVDASSPDAVLSPEFVYHDYNWLTTYLHNVTDNFPQLTNVYSIGKSLQGLMTVSVLMSYCVRPQDSVKDGLCKHHPERHFSFTLYLVCTYVSVSSFLVELLCNPSYGSH